jgi:SAM-dependent methyltransferase
MLDRTLTRLYSTYRPDASPDNDFVRRSPYLRRLIQMCLQHFAAGQSLDVLEVGSGTGVVSRAFAEFGRANVTGVEASLLHHTEACGYKNVKWINQDLVEYLTERPSQYDIIVAFDVLEHLPLDVLCQSLDLIAERLRPGGLLLVHLPNAAAVYGAKVRYSDLTHFHAFTRESLTHLFRNANLEPVSFSEESPVVHGFLSCMRWLVWHSLVAPFRLLAIAETGNLHSGYLMTQNISALARKPLVSSV